MFYSVFLVTEVSQCFSVFSWGHFNFTAHVFISTIKNTQKNYEKTQSRIQPGYWKKKTCIYEVLVFSGKRAAVDLQPRIHQLQGLTAAGRVSYTMCCSAVLPWYHLIVTARCFILLYVFLSSLASPQGFFLLHVHASNH